MAVKLFVVKVFVTLILVNISEGRSPHSKHTLVHSSEELNDLKNQSAKISETNSLNEYVNSTVSTVKRVINALPSPKEILHYGKQALIGVPAEIASNTKRYLCKSLICMTVI